MIVDWDDAYANASASTSPKPICSRGSGRRGPRSFARRAGAEARAELGLAYGRANASGSISFMPTSAAKGLAVFVHGGYWMRFDRSFWSHLAEGAIRRGRSVAVPSYALAPQVHIRDIGRQIARAIGFAAERVPGPIVLAGHCSGGQLAARGWGASTVRWPKPSAGGSSAS